MPEFLQLLPPEDARRLLLSNLATREPASELIDATAALGRVTAEAILAPHPLPEFPRSTVDGYAVHSSDTFGASDSLPAYLTVIGEIPMGRAAGMAIGRGECALIHTGGMLPDGADAVAMVENTQVARPTAGDGRSELEVLRAVAAGENTISVGEDVRRGSEVIPRGRRIRPAEVGGLMALGVTRLRVATKPRVGLLSSGDEVVEPSVRPGPGQVRDVNSYALGALIERYGGRPVRYGILPDDRELLRQAATRAKAECEAVIITAGSSASTRDMTADVIDSLGKPGVLVHGVSTRPGKPTILGVCDGKALIGLPGNPVSALVNGYLFVAPVIERLLGAEPEPRRASVLARLSVNLASQAGREDWWPVKLLPAAQPDGEMQAEPVFGKSNLIFTLVAADGLLRIAPDATGLSAGDLVEIFPL